MHFAAFAYVGESVGDPALYYRNNLCGTLALLDAMREAGVGEIVFSSTCATYGMPDAVPIRETAPQRPVNPYGETKLAIERALALVWRSLWAALGVAALFQRRRRRSRTARSAKTTNPRPISSRWYCRRRSGRRPAIEVYGTDYPTPDGTAIRDYIHVDDLADAHLRALERSASPAATASRSISAPARPFGARGDRRRRGGERPRNPGARGAAAAGRSAGTGRRPQRSRAETLGWRPQYSGLDTIIAPRSPGMRVERVSPVPIAAPRSPRSERNRQ